MRAWGHPSWRLSGHLVYKLIATAFQGTGAYTLRARISDMKIFEVTKEGLAIEGKIGIDLDDAVCARHPYKRSSFPSLWDDRWLKEFTKTGSSANVGSQRVTGPRSVPMMNKEAPFIPFLDQDRVEADFLADKIPRCDCLLVIKN